jgi:hypothetical protein
MAAHAPAPSMPLAISVAIEIAVATAGLANREVGIFPFRRLTLWTRQRCADEPSVHGAFVILSDHRLFDGRRGDLRCVERLGLGGNWQLVLDRRLCDDKRWTRLGNHLHVFASRDGALLLPPWRRNPGLLVLVIGVTRRASRLLDLLVDHRDNRVIGDAAFARTIVVQNVTEPKPALLHEFPRDHFLSGGS